MWLFAKDGFIAIKQHNRQPRLLVVRGRVKGDIERLMSIPARQVVEDNRADYRYRCFLDRDRVADRIAEQVCAIRYGANGEGFKSAVVDKRREAYYFSIWDIGYQMQEELNQ
jgi:hypothetical protein